MWSTEWHRRRKEGKVQKKNEKKKIIRINQSSARPGFSAAVLPLKHTWQEVYPLVSLINCMSHRWNTPAGFSWFLTLLKAENVFENNYRCFPRRPGHLPLCQIMYSKHCWIADLAIATGLLLQRCVSLPLWCIQNSPDGSVFVSKTFNKSLLRTHTHIHTYTAYDPQYVE